MKHHLPPLGDRQIALSAAFSSIIVEINVFRSFRRPFHTNLPFFRQKFQVKIQLLLINSLSRVIRTSSDNPKEIMI